MSLVWLITIVILLVVGFWAVNTYAPTNPPVRLIGNIVLIIILLFIILSVAGLLPMGDVRIR